MADEQEQEQVIGNYTILGRIAVGGQAEIWRARVRETVSPALTAGRVVALKKLRPSLESPESAARLKSRTAALLQVDHPNIVQYLDSFDWNVGRFDEYQVLVMEFLDGQSLKDMIESCPTGMDWDVLQPVITQCLRGLVYACGRGLIHRDLTPSNIFVCRDGAVKLIDFEIARQEQGSQTATVGGVRGKFDYMAPDFAPGYRPTPAFSGDRLSDVFSFGVCLYEALTGTLPFGRRIQEAGDYFDRWPGGKARRVSYSHGMFWVLVNSQALLSKALAVDRTQRYPDFEPLLADFETVHPRIIRHGTEEFLPVAVLGHGGFARVFKTRRKSDGRMVALKYLSAAENAKRFVREAKVLRRLDHPHVVRFIDFIEIPDPEQYFLVMECLPGMPGASLRDRLRSSPHGLPSEEVIALFDRYLDALAYLHAHNVIHRDIKPSNLYAPVGKVDEARILDLGIARDESGTQTVGRLPGTLEYMAPEFARADHGRGDALTDLYSLGVCLYQAIAGRLPLPRLPARTEDALVAFRRRSQAAPTLAFRHPSFRTRPALLDFTSKLMAFDRKERFQTAAEAREALKLVLEAGEEEDAEAATVDFSMLSEPEVPEYEPVGEPLEPETVSPQAQPMAGSAAGGGGEPTAAPAHWRPPLWVWGVAAAAVVALVALVVALVVRPRADPYRAGMIVRVNALANYRLTNYVPELAQAIVDCQEWGARDPEYPMWPDWRKTLADRAAGYPAYFSNEYVRTAADPAAKRRFVEMWGAFQPEADALGWRGGPWERLHQFLQTDAAMADFSARLQARVRHLPDARAVTNAVGLDVANDVAGVVLEYRDSAWPKTDPAVQRMMADARTQVSLLATNYLDGVRRRTAAATLPELKSLDQELARAVQVTPRLRDLVGGGFADARAGVQSLIRERDQDAALLAVQEQVARVNAAADVAAAQQAVERMAGRLPPGDARIDALRTAFAARLQALARRNEDEVASAYEGMNVPAGDMARQALTNFVDSLPAPWKAAVTVDWTRLDGLRAEAAKRRGALDAETQSLIDRLAAVAATEAPADPPAAATNLVAMLAAATPGVAASPAIRTAAAKAWDAVAAGLAARIGEDQPLAERAVRLQSVARIHARPEVRQALGPARMKGLDDALEAQMQAFVLTVANESSVKLTLESRLFPSLPLAPGESQVRRIDLASAPSTQEVVRVVAPAGLQAAQPSFVVRLQRGGAQAVSLSGVAELPVKVVLIGDPMTPPVQGEWLNPTSQQWVAVPPNGILVTPGAQRLRFLRADYTTLERPVDVRPAATSFPVRWPAEAEWTASDALKRLWALEGLWNESNWSELRAALREPLPEFSDPRHRERATQLVQRWGERDREVQSALASLAAAGNSVTNSPGRALDLVAALTATNRALADPIVQQGLAALADRFCATVTNDLPSLPVDRRKEVLSDRRQLLTHAGLDKLVPPARRRELDAAVQSEWGQFVAWLDNASEQACTVRAGTGPERTLDTGGTQRFVLPATGSEVVLQALAGKGYKPQEWRVKAENGGGTRLRVARFEVMPVAVTVDDLGLTAPPVTLRVRRASDPDSAYAALPAGGLLPGEYRLRFLRPDFTTVETNVTLLVGTPSWVLRYPPESQWKATPSMDVLRRLRAASAAADRKAVSDLIGVAVTFERPEHEAEHRKLVADFLQGQRDALRREIARLRGSITDWVAFDYQVADPSPRPSFRYRRDVEARPEKPALNVAFPTNALVGVVEPEAGQLRAVLAAASTPDAIPGEKDRRSAHKIFALYANESGGFPQEVVQYLAAACADGGVPNVYDVQLALYVTYRCWQVPLAFSRNDELKRRDARSWESTLNNHLAKMATVTRNLESVLKAADATGRGDMVERIETLGDARGAAWIAAYLRRFSPGGWNPAAAAGPARISATDVAAVSQDIEEIAALIQKFAPH